MTPLALTVYTLAVWLEASPPESMHLVFSKFCACGGLEFSALLPQNRTESGHKTLSRMQMGLLFPSQGPVMAARHYQHNCSDGFLIQSQDWCMQGHASMLFVSKTKLRCLARRRRKILWFSELFGLQKHVFQGDPSLLEF